MNLYLCFGRLEFSIFTKNSSDSFSEALKSFEKIGLRLWSKRIDLHLLSLKFLDTSTLKSPPHPPFLCMHQSTSWMITWNYNIGEMLV